MVTMTFDLSRDITVKGQTLNRVEAREPTVNDLVEVAKRNLHPAEAEVAYIAIATGASEEEVRTWPASVFGPLHRWIVPLVDVGGGETLSA